AVQCAAACHRRFAEYFKGARGHFSVVPRDVGLGIGIDYGVCSRVIIAQELTVVGRPVVYACRLASAPAGVTLVNHPCFELVSEKYGPSLRFEERDFEAKHEGAILAYELKSAKVQGELAAPGYVSDQWVAGSR
ncbi:MAG: hypothetical protein ABUL72_06955, partial [Armatimonadota bacterium]